MSKIILITGSTDGIGLATAKMLLQKGHKVILHGRSDTKIDNAKQLLQSFADADMIDSFCADLSIKAEVIKLAKDISEKYQNLDILINNAGIYNTPEPITSEGFDLRFAVNLFAPVILTELLVPIIADNGRIINLSSAAQAPVNIDAMKGIKKLSSGEAYAQSKLAITMWSMALGKSLPSNGPISIAVNPASLLGSKMVKSAFGVSGGDINIGADILTRLSLDEEFTSKNGKYFDNDIGKFAAPHPDALNNQVTGEVLTAMQETIAAIN